MPDKDLSLQIVLVYEQWKNQACRGIKLILFYCTIEFCEYTVNLDLNNGSIFTSVLNTLNQIEQNNVFLSGRVNTEYYTEKPM